MKTEWIEGLLVAGLWFCNPSIHNLPNAAGMLFGYVRRRTEFPFFGDKRQK